MEVLITALQNLFELSNQSSAYSIQLSAIMYHYQPLLQATWELIKEDTIYKKEALYAL